MIDPKETMQNKSSVHDIGTVSTIIYRVFFSEEITPEEAKQLFEDGDYKDLLYMEALEIGEVVSVE